ncbi:hypothetical protein Tco_1230150 [Tanacetum coccineum]
MVSLRSQTLLVAHLTNEFEFILELTLSTIFRCLSHKLFRELLQFVKLYSRNIVSRNVLILGIPAPFVIVIVIMVAVVGDPDAVHT